MIRRRRGSALSLVVLVFLLLVMNGIAAYFLITIFGGGREVANLTDAGTLNVAKQSVTISTSVTNYPEFADLVYPYAPGAGSNAPGITLLTFNRCVAKALIVAYNASQMQPPSPQAVTNAQHVIKQLNLLGQDLKTQLSNPKQLYDNFNSSTITAYSNTKMWGNQRVIPQSGSLSYMKVDGATNVYFNTESVPNLFTQPSSEFNVPATNTQMNPIDTENVPKNAVSGYLPGYVDLKVTNVTGTGGPDTHIYGVPVFPQTTPHLVALADFLLQQKPVSNSLPPNAFRIDTSCKVSNTGSVGGAVACAIVGDAYSNSGGITGAGATIGNGMEFAAALPSGYLEFDNSAALTPPPNYPMVQTVMTNNIFNNELGLSPPCPNSTNYMQTGGNNFSLSNPQNSTIVCFSQDQKYLFHWIWKAKFDTTFGLFGLIDPGTPEDLQYGVYVGPINLDLSNPGSDGGKVGPQPIKKYSQITDQQKKWLGSCWSIGMYPENLAFGSGNIASAINCVDYLNTAGLESYCVAAIGTMTQTYHHNVPPYGTPGNAPQSVTNDFSAVDWAKSKLLIDFMTPNTSANAPGAPSGIGTNNPTILDLNNPKMTSGLGVYQYMLKNPNIQKVVNPPNMPTPSSEFAGSLEMPVERIGSIYDLLRSVESGPCMKDTINKITISCQQIQPTTTSQSVLAMLKNTQMPMGTPGSQGSKVFIYLKNADLSKALTADAGPPPNYNGGLPDGNLSSGGCYSNTYPIDENIVDAGHDMGVHLRPYANVTGSLSATDSINFTPGSGYNNSLGRFLFQETTAGTSSFVHIN